MRLPFFHRKPEAPAPLSDEETQAKIAEAAQNAGSVSIDAERASDLVGDNQPENKEPANITPPPAPGAEPTVVAEDKDTPTPTPVA